jgi:integrase
MSWSEIDLDRKLWTIPAERMKSDSSHVVPLAPEAIAILESLPRWSGPFVFSTTDGQKPSSGFSKMKERIDEAFPEKIAAWCFHDLRRTMRTGLSALRIPDIVSELCIAHTQPKLHKVYDQHSYLDEKRHAFDAWAARVRTIVDGTDGSNVVPLAAARGRPS